MKPKILYRLINLTKKSKRILGLTIMTITCLSFIMMVWFLLYPVSMSAIMAMERKVPAFGETTFQIKLLISYLGVVSTGFVLVIYVKTIKGHYRNLRSRRQ